MLQNDFFTFTPLQTEGNIVKTNIELDVAHPIFKGHFPDQPVVPGVCMVQMVKEILEADIKAETKLIKAHDIKFLAFIDPLQNKLVQMELKITPIDEGIKVDAKLLDDEIVLFKFKGIFIRK